MAGTTSPGIRPKVGRGTRTVRGNTHRGGRVGLYRQSTTRVVNQRLESDTQDRPQPVVPGPGPCQGLGSYPDTSPVGSTRVSCTGTRDTLYYKLPTLRKIPFYIHFQ